MWPFSSGAPEAAHPPAEPSACPVDHSTREAWLAQNPPSSSRGPRAPHPTPAAALSTAREVSSIPRWHPANAASAPDSSADDKWVYPSPSSFFSALVRKERDPNPEDMPVVVPIHNAVNERVWAQVLDWEREAGAAEGASKLVSFVGRPKDLSPRARWKTLIGYSAPFDRHDWLVDRPVSSPGSDTPSSIRIRYVIDFYTGRLPLLPAAPPSPIPGGRPEEAFSRPNLAFYIDCRPALDGLEGVQMRAKRFWARWMGPPEHK